MAKKYFGTDGVRGEVGQFPITPEFVLKLGYAAGRVLVHHDGKGRPTVLIGKDTRISGYMLEAALVAGFTAAGVNVIQTGPLPTPGVAYLTRALRLAAGVMISASHNAYADNGIKFFAAGGVKLSDKIELEIEAELEKEMRTKPSSELGRARRISGADDRYIEFCKSTFPGQFDLRGLKLVVDTANGAGYGVAPKVFHELGAEVVSIGDEPNGYNINDKCGATHPKTLQAAVLQSEADYGVALDGDGDRLMMVDKNGKVYDGDKLIYVIAKAWVKEKARGTERYGLLASAEGKRLRGLGISVSAEMDHVGWFLNEKEHVNSSYYLEVPASEFEIQGLEIDYALLAWDADFRYVHGTFDYYRFRGTQWNHIRQEQRKKYLKNAYRVLLTRARQGLVIFVPEGDADDATRKAEYYDGTYEYLRRIGIAEIH